MGTVKRIMSKAAPFIMALGGVMFVVMGIVGLGHQRNYSRTKAVITQIESYMTAGEDSHWDHTVMVEYTVDGKTYVSELDSYQSGYFEGKELEILYDPADPSKIATAGYVGVVAPLGFGVLMLAAFGATVYRNLKNTGSLFG